MYQTPPWALRKLYTLLHAVRCCIGAQATDTHSQPAANFTFTNDAPNHPPLPAGASGIGEAVAPVLDYLTCFYSSLEDEKTRGKARTALESSSPGKATDNGDGLRSEKQENFLNLYKGLLDGQGAAPGA